MVLAHDIVSEKRTIDVQTNNDVLFNTMLLSQYTLEGLKYAGFHRPSPIQLHGIPLGKCGFDLLLEAKSGTGKTLVFSIIALDKLNLNLGLQCVILAPTREIAYQICDVIREIGHYYPGLCVEPVIGGLDVRNDIKKIKTRKIHIVVGSPGRLRHLIQDKHIDVSQVKLIVLDEADKLIEKSFQSDINYIFASLPHKKQVIMSSATYSEAAKEFIGKYVTKVQLVCPDSTSILLGIKQQVTFVKCNSNVIKQTEIKYSELTKILSKHSFKQCLIFCNYQARVEELHKMLRKDKWPAEKLHGQQEQIHRLDALRTLQEFKCRILISTDLAARGIDASNVDLVINFEPPLDWQTYLHRIGRAGRYGSYGLAITILSVGNENTKFKITLSSFSDSLNIIEMDSGNRYDLKCEGDMQSESKLETKEIEDSPLQIKVDNTDDQLWKAFTEVPSQISDISTFDELIQSFCDTSNKITLDSSENSSFLDVTKQLNNIELNDSFIDLNNEFKSENRLSESRESNESESQENRNNSSQKINNGYKNHWCDNSKQIHINKDTTTLDNSQCNKNLMAPMGLPTEFGKIRKNKNKSNIKRNHEYPTGLQHDESYDAIMNQEYFTDKSINKSSNTIKTKLKSHSKDNIFSTRTNTYPDHKYQSISRHKPFYKNTHVESINSSTSSNSINKTRDSHLDEQYASWYNALKFRTKQIEMLCYINEMSQK